ncbi:MAG: NADH-quinone oxidoreductase, chain [Acidimicrobiales bacterium]|nr:NADH-quinone oxidoreductase, chain [Acidimicrobiales bacterium]
MGDDGRPQQLPWEDWSDLADVVEHTSAWVRATAPSGSAAYEGRVGWSGELGFGVKPPERGQTADPKGVEAVEEAIPAADLDRAHDGGGH